MSDGFTQYYANLVEIFGFAAIFAVVLAAMLYQRFTRMKRESEVREIESRAVRKSEERFRSLAQNSSDIITLLDRDGTVLYQSESAIGVLGREPVTRIGQNAIENSFAHPEDVEKQKEYFQEVLDNPGVDLALRYRVRHADGSFRHVEAVGRNLLDDPSVKGIVITHRDITERHRAEQARRENEHRFKQLFEQSVDALLVHDADGRIVDCNSEACRSLGYTREEMLSLSVKYFALGLLSDEERTAKKGDTLWERALSGEAEGIAGLHRGMHRRKDGTVFPVETGVGAIFYGDRRLIFASCRDITERERDRKSLERLASFPDLTPAPIIEVAPSGVPTYMNRAARRLFPDLEKDGVLHPVVSELDLDHTESIGESDNPLNREVEVGERAYHQVVFRVPGSDLIRIYAMDVTERRDFERQLQYQAFHDPLTGLPNRTLFMDRLEQALARVSRRGASCAVLFLDLDRFKVVNDSLGHETGDRLLIKVAGILRESLRPEDTVVRLGGDEFAILMEEVRDPGVVLRVAERVEDSIRRPYRLGEHEVFVSASIGITLSSPDEQPDDLLRHADIAMYRAKNAGGGRHEVFDGMMGEQAAERLRLEGDLRRALEREEFTVHYQPKVELISGNIVGVEALVRWIHPVKGLVPPLDFIPIAEETGLIQDLGSWVLRESCRQLQVWHGLYPDIRGARDEPLVVSVNLSARQFRHPDLVEQVENIVRETGIDPRSLELEITESAVMEGTDRAVATLKKLKDLGVGIAIDDFGTGYSSLGYLKNFPVDVLKIDKSFVDGLGSGGDPAITSAVIELAHALDMKVVAEGIENAEQLHELMELGSELGQGYYFSKPLTTDALENLLDNTGTLYLTREVSGLEARLDVK